MKRGMKFVLFFILIFAINFSSAAAIGNSLHLNIQTTNSTGAISGTFVFGFNISTVSTCAAANVVYADAATLTTDSRGIISYYLDNINLDFSNQYWLCYYRDGTLINASKIARSPYSFTSKNVTVSGIQADADLNLGTTYGIIAGNATFNNGWTSNGVSILGSDIFAKTLYVYNITSLSVSNLNINGSIFPSAGFDNQFDLGSPVLRWKNLYLAGTVYGLFNWKIKTDASLNYLNFNGSDLSFNEAQLNTTIDSRTSGLSGGNLSWNEAYANTLYYGINNPSGFFNASNYQSYNATYAGYASNVSRNWTSDAVSYLTNVYNATWSSTYNATYASSLANNSWNQTYADTLYAPNTTAGIQILINSTGVYSTYNATYANGMNTSWNESYANTLYAPNTTAGIQYLLNSTGIYNQANGNTSWNQTYANTLYAPNTTAGIQALINSTGVYDRYNSTYNIWVNNTYNSTYAANIANNSWNEAYANTLYYGINNPSGFFNASNYQSYNATYASGMNTSWNESYANTLYLPNASNINLGIYNLTTTGILTTGNQICNSTVCFTLQDLNTTGSGLTNPFNGNFSIVNGAINVSNFFFANSTRVGIGNSSPSSILEIYANQPVFTLNTNSASNKRSRIDFKQSGTTTAQIYTDTGMNNADTLSFQVSGGQELLLNKDNLTFQGNVGIATPNPSYLLEIAKSATAMNVSGMLYVNTSSIGIGTFSNTYLLTIANNAKALNVSGLMYVNSSNVGIGTTSPTQTLEVSGVAGGSTSSVLFINDTTDTGNPRTITTLAAKMNNGSSNYLVWGRSLSNYNAATFSFRASPLNTGASSYLSFGLYGVDDVLTMVGNGAVGINTTIPSSMLSINGAGNSTSTLYSYSSGGIAMFANSSSTGIYSFGGDKGIISYGTNFDFYGGNAAADNYFAGSVGIGVTAPAYSLEIAKSATAMNISGLMYVNTTRVIIGGLNPTIGANGNNASLVVYGKGHLGEIRIQSDQNDNPMNGGRITFNNIGGTSLTQIDAVGDGFGTGYVNFSSYNAQNWLFARWSGSAVKVGINTATPATTLNVAGATNITGNLAVGGTVVGGSTIERAYNSFGASPTPGSGGMTTTSDVYIKRNLEVDGTFYLTGGYGSIVAGDVAENLQTIQGRKAMLCSINSTGCLVNDYNKEELNFGDVVCIDTRYGQVIMKCNESNSHLVAGVVSNTSKISMGNNPKYAYPIAVAGVVFTKVSNENGNILPGDLLVSASKPGYAMKAPENYKTGTILGKAYDFCDYKYKECTIPMFVALG